MLAAPPSVNEIRTTFRTMPGEADSAEARHTLPHNQGEANTLPLAARPGLILQAKLVQISCSHDSAGTGIGQGGGFKAGGRAELLPAHHVCHACKSAGTVV